jgi:hypothetical protein
MLILRRPWTEQPQDAVEVNSSNVSVNDFLILPSLGPVELVKNTRLLATGSAPSAIAGPPGRGWYNPAAASENGYRFGTSPSAAGTGIYVFRADAVPSAVVNNGLGAEYLHISWDHTNASFRGVVARRNNLPTWVTASLGTLVGGVTYCIAVLWDGVNLYAIKDGQVITTVAAGGTLTASVAGWGSNQVAAQGNTPGMNVFGAFTSNQALPLAWVLEATKSPAAFWNAMFAPRQIWIPATAAASFNPTLSLPTYVPGSLTSSAFRPRVTATWS